MSRYLPRIERQSGGSPVDSGPDRFAPKYLVGNTSNGDSAVPYLQDGFQYIPDPGDGSGILAALTALPPGDVWIRPGVYNMSTGGLPIPPNVRVSGAGNETVLVYNVPKDASGPLFLLQNGSDLRDMRIEVFDAQDTTIGQGVIEALSVFGTAVQCYCSRVDVLLNRSPASTSTVLSVFYVPQPGQGSVTLDAERCSVTMVGNAQGVLSGWLGEGSLRLDRCVASGGGRAVFIDAGGTAVNVSLDQCEFSSFQDVGIVVLGGRSRIQGCLVQSASASNPTGVFFKDGDFAPAQVAVSASRVEVPCLSQGSNIAGYFDVTFGQVVGSWFRGSQGIVSANPSGRGVTVGFNHAIAQAGQQIVFQVNDEVAHNILNECPEIQNIIVEPVPVEPSDPQEP
jgi:hypothetical protein